MVERQRDVMGTARKEKRETEKDTARMEKRETEKDTAREEKRETEKEGGQSLPMYWLRKTWKKGVTRSLMP